jgi:hypothetical protein
VRWRKLGRIYEPEGKFAWARSHAANPVAEHCGGDRFGVYFGARDERNRSSIGWVEIDLRRPREILACAERPLLSPGEPGSFDDSGVSMGCLAAAPDGRSLLYYLGWNVGGDTPWRNRIGLAVRRAGEAHFEKLARPVLDLNEADPHSLSYPWVLADAPGWRMWYGSNLDWGPDKADLTHVIKCAESRDGTAWTRNGATALGFRGNGEFALSRPCVLKEKGRYKMWFSFRGETYRIGYAESDDGRSWTRDDARAGIDVSPSGWDSESIEYPHVFDHAGRRYMLYNGNGYGRTGFGLAVLDAGD